MDRVCFHVFGRPVYWYGVMVALAFLAGMTHWSRTARKLGRPPDTASDLTFWMMVGGLVGARIAYILANLDVYVANPVEILRFDHGGLVFYGGAIGGTVAVALLARRHREPFLALGDFTVPALSLGHALGRVGCFLNHCCYGSKTTGWMGVTWYGEHRIPVQLIEAALNLALYGGLTWFLFRRPRTGRVVAAYLLFYPVIRFLLEFIRGDERIVVLGPFNAAQVTSLILFATGLGLWFHSGRAPSTAAPASRDP